MNEVMDVILITKNGDTSGRNLYRKLTESGVEVERIFLDRITLSAREKLLQAIIVRFYGDLEELLVRGVEQYYDIEYIRDLKLSEFISTIAETPRLLTAPIVLNQYNGVIIGYNKGMTVADYVGRQV